GQLLRIAPLERRDLDLEPPRRVPRVNEFPLGAVERTDAILRSTAPRGNSQICHGSPARCWPLNKTDWASGDKAGSADVTREGASGRETPLANTNTLAPAGKRSPAWSGAWTSYCGASVYRNAPDNAAAPTGRHKKSSIRSPTRPPESDFHT